MTSRQMLVEKIFSALSNVLETYSDTPPAEINEDTRLYGENGILDSMALVALVMEVEEFINEKSTHPVTLVDVRAMSGRNSPFRTVGSMADFALIKMEKANENNES